MKRRQQPKGPSVRQRRAAQRKALPPIPRGLLKSIRNADEQQMEKKFWDTFTPTPALITYNGTVFGFTDVVQGSSDTTRVGDLLTVKRFRYKAFVAYNGSAGFNGSYSQMRLLIFAWKPFFASNPPTVAQVMTYTGTAYAVSAPYSHDNRNQFVLFHDETISLDASQISHVFDVDLKMSHDVQYKAGSTTNCAGGISAILMSNTNGGAGVDPYMVNYAGRIDFIDC